MGYVIAERLEEAWSALAAWAGVIAGGTVWFPRMGDRIGEVSLLDVTRLSGYAAISIGEGGWRIGAAVTWSDVVRAELPGSLNALKRGGARGRFRVDPECGDCCGQPQQCVASGSWDTPAGGLGGVGRGGV